MNDNSKLNFVKMNLTLENAIALDNNGLKENN